MYSLFFTGEGASVNSKILRNFRSSVDWLSELIEFDCIIHWTGCIIAKIFIFIDHVPGTNHWMKFDILADNDKEKNPIKFLKSYREKINLMKPMRTHVALQDFI